MKISATCESFGLTRSSKPCLAYKLTFDEPGFYPNFYVVKEPADPATRIILTNFSFTMETDHILQYLTDTNGTLLQAGEGKGQRGHAASWSRLSIFDPDVMRGFRKELSYWIGRLRDLEASPRLR